MRKSLEELTELWMMKLATGPHAIVNPPSLQDASAVGEEALEGGPAAAAVIVPVTSAIAGDLDSHVPPLALEVVGSEGVADEVVVPTLVPAIEDVMVPLVSATSLGPEQSGEDQLCSHSGSLGIVGCDVEADAFIPSIASPARTSHDGAGGTEGVPSLAVEPKPADAPCASSSLVEEWADLVSADLLSRSLVPVEDEPPSRKRRRESESSSPPSLPPPPVTANPSPVPPSSGSFSNIPELGNLQSAALWLGERFFTPVGRAFFEQQGAREQMKEALYAVSKVCHYMANFATQVSRNFPLELSCAQERIQQLEAHQEQDKASINLLGQQCDQAEAALVEAEERIARREAELQKVEKRLIEKERHCAMISKSCSRAEDELRHLRDIRRKHQEQEHPGQRRSRLIEGSSRSETEHPISRRSSSSTRSDRQSEERKLAKGKEFVDLVSQSSFSAGFEQHARLMRDSGPNVKFSAQDEVMRNVSAEFQSRYEALRPEL